jgi:hypothetical protein
MAELLLDSEVGSIRKQAVVGITAAEILLYGEVGSIRKQAVVGITAAELLLYSEVLVLGSSSGFPACSFKIETGTS